MSVRFFCTFGHLPAYGIPPKVRSQNAAHTTARSQ